MSNVRLVATLQIDEHDIRGDVTGLPMVVIHEDFPFTSLGEALAYYAKLQAHLAAYPVPGEPATRAMPSEERLTAILDRPMEVESRGLAPVAPESFDPRERFQL